MTYEEAFNQETIDRMVADGLDVPAKEDMTCHDCEHTGTCEFAWDLYNTNGDCLAQK